MRFADIAINSTFGGPSVVRGVRVGRKASVRRGTDRRRKIVAGPRTVVEAIGRGERYIMRIKKVFELLDASLEVKDVAIRT